MREYNSSTCIEHKNTTVIFSKEAYKIFTCNFAPKGTNQASYNTTPYKTKQNKRKHRNNEFTKTGVWSSEFGAIATFPCFADQSLLFITNY